MNRQMVMSTTEHYNVKEAGVIIAAIAFVISLGGMAVAAIVICGWQGARSVTMDWLHGKAIFYCR